MIAPDRKVTGLVLASFRQVVKGGELRLHPKKKVLELRLTKTGRALMGEVAEARFRALAAALEVEPVIV